MILNGVMAIIVRYLTKLVALGPTMSKCLKLNLSCLQ